MPYITRDVPLYSIDLSIMPEFTLLPFKLAGKVYRSALPYGSYDPDGKLLEKYKAEQITLIVVLAEKSEMFGITGRDLIALYQQQAWRVLHMPVKDFAVPYIGDLMQAVSEALKAAGDGENIAIHCSAGIGRTGLFVACMAKQAWGMSGEQAIEWVRQYIPQAVETDAQRQLMMEY